jgi:hypothetical protein
MKKRRTSRDQDFNPEDRKRNLHFKKKKQRSLEREFNPKRLTELGDFDDFNEDNYE